jgi:hypothetical protein
MQMEGALVTAMAVSDGDDDGPSCAYTARASVNRRRAPETRLVHCNGICINAICMYSTFLAECVDLAPASLEPHASLRCA